MYKLLIHDSPMLQRITIPLGKARFALVDRAIWHDSTGMITEVAVKSLAKGSPAQDQFRLLREAAIMMQFHHSNIIALYGIVYHKNEVFKLCSAHSYI